MQLKDSKPKEIRSNQLVNEGSKEAFSYLIDKNTSAMEEDFDKVVNELNKFCLKVDDEFKRLIKKLTVSKVTMEALTLNSSLAQ